MATVFIASGPHDGRWFPLGKKSLVFGRDEGVLAQVTDPGISRKHLTVRYDPDNDRYFALDMGSTNGVFVNNSRIDDEVPLDDSDLIRIGDTLLLFVTQDFSGEDNALNFYRERGQREVKTLEIEGPDAQKAMKQFREAQAEEDAKGQKTGD